MLSSLLAILGRKLQTIFFEVLSTFECPVFYVYGNWDNELDYNQTFTDRCTHLHLNLIRCGGFVFAGFSGCGAHWGKNPIVQEMQSQFNAKWSWVFKELEERQQVAQLTGGPALAKTNRDHRNAQRRFKHDKKKVEKAFETENRRALIQLLNAAQVDPKRLVLVTHERQYRLHEDMPGCFLHLFGHRHGFKRTSSHNSHFVNVSALDRTLTIYPKGMTPNTRTSMNAQRNVDAGSYAIIEVFNSLDIRVESRQLWTDASDEWEIHQYGIYGCPWLDNASN